MASASRPLLTQIAWHSLAILVLLCLPLLKFQALWWNIPRRELAAFAVLLGAYGVSALAVMLFVRSIGAAAATRALLITLSIFCLFLASLLLLPIETPRDLLAPVLVAAIVLIPLSVTSERSLKIGGIALGVALLATGGLAAYMIDTEKETSPPLTAANVSSAFYNLRATSHEDVIPAPATHGGGLDRLGDAILLVDGGGRLYLLSHASDGPMHARELPTRAPFDRSAFVAALGADAPEPPTAANGSKVGMQHARSGRYRVADVVTHSDGDAVRIFVSHHHWNAAEECFVVRVSNIDASLGALDESLRQNDWRTLYESSPCIALAGEAGLRGDQARQARQMDARMGGRMALLDGDTLLLTLGDQGFSGSGSTPAFSQDPAASYGKTIRIDLHTGSGEIYTLGHRDPQGLYIAGDGRIWLTEHTAQGGDEVNLLSEQANYGWPLATYGSSPGRQPEGHESFTQPAFAWTPGVGVTGVVGVERELFELWRGDLIAGSLADRALHRLVIADDRIVLDERIEVGRPVRDIIELDDGRLLLWTDDYALITLEPAR